EQQPAQRGLAGADLAGELDEAAAAALVDPEQQVRQGVAVPFAQVHEARVRGDRERRLAEAEVRQVPGAKVSASCPWPRRWPGPRRARSAAAGPAAGRPGPRRG